MSTYEVTLKPQATASRGGKKHHQPPQTIKVNATCNEEAVNHARGRATKMGLDWWAITKVQEISGASI